MVADRTGHLGRITLLARANNYGSEYRTSLLRIDTVGHRNAPLKYPHACKFSNHVKIIQQPLLVKSCETKTVM